MSGGYEGEDKKCGSVLVVMWEVACVNMRERERESVLELIEIG